MLSEKTLHPYASKKNRFICVQFLGISMQILLCLTIVGCSSKRNLIESGEAELNNGLTAYERGEYEHAFQMLKPIAEQGDAMAQTKLGNMYYLGLGVPEDNTEAAKWFEKAVQQGDLEAHVLLGTLYVLGAGVPLDYSAAAELFRVPAEWGIGGAQFLLGTLYMYGRGVPQNKVEAYVWMQLAAERGSKNAKEACEQLSLQMNKAEIAQAGVLLKDWKPRRALENQ